MAQQTRMDVVLAYFERFMERFPSIEALAAESESPRDFNQGLMEIGALICAPRNPSCDRCPVRSHCVALQTGRIGELPRAKPKPAMREMTVALYVVTNRGRVMMQREKGKLM